MLFQLVRILLCLAVLSPLSPAGAVTSGLSFGKAFSPSTIGPGNVSTLTFTIINTTGAPVTDLAFTDNFPMGLSIASPANIVTNCIDAAITTPDAWTFSLTDGAVAANGSCTISVNVSAIETATNTAGTLSSSLPDVGGPSATLTVSPYLPGFTKLFTPSAVQLGGRSTLQFTIDNSGNEVGIVSAQFTDTLPTGMVIASPSNATTDCGSAPLAPSLTAVPGSDLISFQYSGIGAFPAVSGGSSCSVSVDVVATGIGSLGNITSELNVTIGFTASLVGRASAVLDVQGDQLSLIKTFTDDPVAPGGTTSLEFTITNFDRTNPATSISFFDDLNGTLSGLVPVLPLPTDPCGAGSILTYESPAYVLSFSGGSLAADGGTCTFSVDLAVPGGAAEGAYENTTSDIFAEIGGGPVAGAPASDTLYVAAVPQISKSFTDDPIAAGDSVTLEYTITNPSLTDAASAIAFIDDLTNILPFPSSVTLPADGFCGGSASITKVSTGIDRDGVSMTGGSLAAGDSCIFSVTIDIPDGFPGGTYPSTSGEVKATISGETRTGNTASDNLVVVGAPRLVKAFTTASAFPGSLAGLEFTISHDVNAPAGATAIAFTDDLSAALPGLAVTDTLPIADVCGAGSSLGGTVSNLSLTGGTLAAGESCTFSVTTLVPGNAPSGNHTNTTSNLVATVDGVSVTGNVAEADLTVAGLRVTKAFIDDPVIPGGDVTLRFTITNPASDVAVNATDISFTDTLANVLPGTPDLTVKTLPAAGVCGGTTDAITDLGSGLLLFDSGDAVIPVGGNCVIDVVLTVPAGAADGSYRNTTSSISATLGGAPVILGAVSDTLTISSNLLTLAKSYTNDPVAPGDAVTLQFTINNLGTEMATDIGFTDDLDASLAGLVATGLPVSDVCGAGSEISGTDLLTLTGGTLAAGASCTFNVSLTVPVGAVLGSSALNTTSDVTGMIGGLPVVGDPASDTLLIDAVVLTKSFDGPSTPGGDVVLSFNLRNADPVDGIDRLAFADDLDGLIPGLAATGLPLSDVCGAGSLLEGTGVITLTGGDLLPSGSCSFDVTVHVPDAANAGDYTNTTTVVTANGIQVGSPATAALTINAPPVPPFSKVFAPDAVFPGGISTLTFTIDNSGSTLAATALDFKDRLPGGVLVATPANATTDCTGGTLTAVPASRVIAYTGGSVAAGDSCTVQVDVIGKKTGAHTNTTRRLVSSLGVSNKATDILTVEPAPVFSKAFAPDVVVIGETTTLVFTVDNTAGSAAVTGLSFMDRMPDAMVVATPANASTTCTGGTLTAMPDTYRVSYDGGAVAAGSSCTVQVDVKGLTLGVHANTTSKLLSSAGYSDRGTAVLNVVNPPPLRE